MIDFFAANAGVIGLVFFVTVFMLIALWALRPANKEKIESYKNIPLSEEPHDIG